MQQHEHSTHENTQEGQDGLFALDLMLLQQKSDTSVK